MSTAPCSVRLNSPSQGRGPAWAPLCASLSYRLALMISKSSTNIESQSHRPFHWTHIDGIAPPFWKQAVEGSSTTTPIESGGISPLFLRTSGSSRSLTKSPTFISSPGSDSHNNTSLCRLESPPVPCFGSHRTAQSYQCHAQAC